MTPDHVKAQYLRAKAAEYVWTFLGLPYRWGGDDPIQGFDCSGLIVEVLQAVGLLPHGSDLTANGLYLRYSKNVVDRGYAGCLCLWFNQAMIEILKANHRGGDIYVWGASGPAGMRQRLALVEAGFHWSATIIWKKQQFILSPSRYQRMYEPCFYGWLKRSSFRGDRKQTEIWEVNRPSASDQHPTMKPVELCALGLVNSSKPGQIVLNLFLGSGSTLIAAEISDRACYGMEIDPKYCDVIIQRFAKYTGISEREIRKSAK